MRALLARCGPFVPAGGALAFAYHPVIRNALGGGGSPDALGAFPPITLALCADFCLSSRWIFVCLVFGFIVCLVCSFRHNGLDTLALAAFGCVRALRAHCGAFGTANALKRVEGGCTPPLNFGGIGILSVSARSDSLLWCSVPRNACSFWIFGIFPVPFWSLDIRDLGRMHVC